MFLNINLRPGYHQVGITKEYTYKTTFLTKYGHYDFLLVPFGLTNSLTTFMCFMCLKNSVLCPYVDKFLIVFIDDILIYYKSEEVHAENLAAMLRLLREH